MTNEQDRVLQILQLAIKMERDGKEFYTKASQESRHELGKKLLANLAAEEDKHRLKFVEIYEALRQKKAWPKTGFEADRGKTIKTIFAAATAESTPATSDEQDAIRMAIDMEIKSYNLYNTQAKEASAKAEKDFFHTLAAEERGHQLALTDYLEFLKDPSGWFVVKEHHSLDGG